MKYWAHHVGLPIDELHAPKFALEKHPSLSSTQIMECIMADTNVYFKELLPAKIQDNLDLLRPSEAYFNSM